MRDQARLLALLLFAGFVCAIANAADLPATAPAPVQYRIGIDDVLDISVWNVAELQKTLPVRPDGKISLPLIGDVQAVGMTPDQLTKEIVNRLKEFKENPNVSVVVQQVNSYGVFVLGEVAHPGKYQLKSFTSVLQAVSLAGGFTPYAAKSKMFLLRKMPDRDSEVRIPIDYDEIVSGEDSTHNVILVPGDTLVVP